MKSYTSFIARDEVFGLVALVFMLLVFGGAVLGYVFNLVAIATWSSGVGMLVLRILGAILVPLGAILGWIK